MCYDTDRWEPSFVGLAALAWLVPYADAVGVVVAAVGVAACDDAFAGGPVAGSVDGILDCSGASTPCYCSRPFGWPAAICMRWDCTIVDMVVAWAADSIAGTIAGC